MNNQKDQGLDPQTAMGMFLVLVRCWSLSVAVFIRGRFGQRYLHWLIGAWIWQAVFFVFVGRHREAWALVVLFEVGFVLAVCHAVLAVRRWRKGEAWHSYYSGEPLLCRVLPLSEQSVKRYAEPLVVFAVGLCLADYWPVCLFLTGGAAALAAEQSAARAYEDRIIQDHLDATIEQEEFARKFRR